MLVKSQNRFAGLALSLGIALCAIPGPATAQSLDYPNKTIRLISAYPAGGNNDLVARGAAQKMTELLGQQVIVENIGGAAGNIGTNTAAKAKPDGYTLLLAAATNVIIPFLYDNLQYDFLKDFESVGMLTTSRYVLVARSGFPANNLQELIAYAKAHPRTVTYATPGVGTPGHIAGELLARSAGIELKHVPYRGNAQANLDLFGGRVDLTFSSADGAPVLKDSPPGSVKPIAALSKQRNPKLPDLPTISEAGFPDYEISTWYGVLVPTGTPKPIIDRLSAVLKQVAADPEVIKHFEINGQTAQFSTPAELRKRIEDETKRLGPIVKAADMKPQ